MDIFLDMTGTITDLESENHAFLKMSEEIARKFKIDLSPKEVMNEIIEYRKPFMEKRAEKYVPIRFLIADAVEHVTGRKLNEEDRREIHRIYADYHAKYVKLAPKAMDALRIMRDMSQILGVVTDADTPYTEKVLNALGIKDLFDCVITAEDAGVGKPNPKIFQMAMDCGKTEPKIFIGDSERRDVKGAKKVGFVTIKIGRKTNEANFLAENLYEAAEIIRKFFYRDNVSP